MGGNYASATEPPGAATPAPHQAPGSGHEHDPLPSSLQPSAAFPHPEALLPRAGPGLSWGIRWTATGRARDREAGVQVRKAIDTCALPQRHSTSAPGYFSVRPARHRHSSTAQAPPCRLAAGRSSFPRHPTLLLPGGEGRELSGPSLARSLPPSRAGAAPRPSPPTSGYNDVCAPQRRRRPVDCTPGAVLSVCISGSR